MSLAPPTVPLPSRAAVDRALAALDRSLGSSKVDTSDSGRETFSADESEAPGRLADAVVHASDTEDVRAVLRIASECGVPVTPRAGGTGRTGGAVPVAGGIVLDTRTLSKVIEIDRDELLAVVQPGVVTGELHALCESEGLFYPPDPNSLASCCIGGNVAENAGGPRAFKYGVTREYVLGLEACMVGGDVVRTGRRTVKGVTGYDVTGLLVGSEGTLAVFTEVVLRLRKKPVQLGTVMATFTDARAAVLAVTRTIGSGLVPRCMELMDAPTLVALRRSGAAVRDDAGALLLVEVDGDDVDRDLERLGEILDGTPGCQDVLAAQDAAQRARLWEARRQLSPATRKLARHKLSEDVVVPRGKMIDLLDRTARIGDAEGVRHLTYGHAGDGNLHVNFLWDDDDERPAVERALEALMRATIELGGTLSGEHGIGLTKMQYLRIEQSSSLIALQQNLKKVFDPNGLLNPGKIFPRGHGGC